MKQTKALTEYISISEEVGQALREGKPIVALESTVITHGLPYPENLSLARSMEQTVREFGAVPATIGVLEGIIYAGLHPLQLESLAQSPGVFKISVRDLAPAIAFKRSGGTTVAGTLLVGHIVGLKVFATGGIGGVHRSMPGEPGISYDISADLPQLASTPLVVVCAGAKSILDLPGTLEMLETLGVPVVGYQTNQFPAFFSLSSGLPVSVRVDSPDQAAQIAKAHWGLGVNSAVLVTVPPPPEAALPVEAINGAMQIALEEVQVKHIHGQEVSPYLLRRVSELTEGSSLKANLALLLNNAKIAAQIAKYL